MKSCSKFTLWSVTLLIVLANVNLSFAKTLSVRMLSIEDGLSQSTINDILHGPNGFYWIGTQDGLNRFDGYDFKVFNKKNSPTLKSSFINVIETLDSNNLLIATQNGLFVFNLQSEEFTLVSEVPSGSVSDVFVEQDKITVIAERKVLQLNRGLSLIEGIEFSQANSNFQKSLFKYNNNVYFISEQHTIVAARASTVLPPALTKFNQTPFLQIYSAICTDSHLWLATNQGVYQIHNDTIEHLIQNLDARYLAIEPNNQFWVAGQTGLFRKQNIFNPESELLRFNTETNQQGVLSGRAFSSLYIDDENLIWVGTRNEGVAIHSPKTDWFENHSIYSGEYPLPSEDVLSLHVDNDSLWLASASGAALYQPSENFIYNSFNQEAIKEDRVTFVTKDEEGTVWLGFLKGGLAYKRINQQDFTTLVLADNQVQVTDIILHKGNKFIASRNHGIFKVDKYLNVTHFTKDDNRGLTTNRIQSLFVDDSNNFWVGSFDSGLFSFNLSTGQFTPLQETFNSPLGLLNEELIIDITQIDESLWLATTRGVLIVNLLNEHIEQISTDDGLPNNTIYGFIEDNEQQIWMPTNQGLVKLNPFTMAMSIFTKRDGFLNNEYNANAFVRSDDGRIWLGGVKGLTILSPDKRPKSELQSAPKLVDVKLFNNPLSKAQKQEVFSEGNNGRKLTFSPSMSMFTLYFSNQNASNAFSTTFRYRMFGFNDQWVYNVPGQNFATFTNLSPGSYQFYIESSLDGVKWSAADPITITVLHKPWSSPLAKAMYLIIALGVISIFVIQARTKRKLEVESFNNIQQKAQRLRLSMQTSASIMWELNINRNSVRLVDYSNEDPQPTFYDFTPEGVSSFVFKDDIELFISAIQNQIKADHFSGVQLYRAIDPTGTVKWMKGAAIVSDRDANGKIKKVVGIGHNVDELKRTEGELQKLNTELEQRVEERTDKLNVANRDLKITLDNLRFAQEELVESQKMASLGGMVAGISHEVNTPLGICVTSVSHLKSKLKFIDEKFDSKSLTATDFKTYQDDSKTSLDLLEKNIVRATELIASFKQVSVEQSNECSSQFNLNKILHDSVMTLTPKLKNSQVNVSIDCDPNFELVSYQGAISQIIINLIMNSIEHGFKGLQSGNIKIVVSNILSEYDELLLIYSDDGAGIPDNNLVKVFEPFYTSNRGGGNTGLGMHITYNLTVQKLKGAIAVNSLINTGTEFYIRIPKDVEKA